MPFKNEHTCRLQSPIKDNKRTSELQSVRFNNKKFTSEETKKWCNDNKGPFEAEKK